MKILFILENTIKNLEGGTEVSAHHLARLLRKKGHKVEEWSPYQKRKPTVLYTGFLFQLFIFLLLMKKVMKKRLQIIHVQGKYLLPPAIATGKLFHIPVVATIRDYVVICPIGLCLFDTELQEELKELFLRPQERFLINKTKHSMQWFLKYEIPKFVSIYHPNDHLMIRIIRWSLLIRGWFITFWLRWWLKRAEAVVAVSRYAQKVLKDQGIDSIVIHNAFDPTLMPKSPITSRQSLARQTSQVAGVANRSTILFVGKPSYGKGHDLYISLSRQPQFKDYVFKTVGGRAKLPYDKTLQEIANALVVVVPSRWPEPFGRVALESLAIGTPVLVTNQGGLPEIVEDGVTGLVSAPKEKQLSTALSKILKENNSFRDRLRKNTEKLIEKFQNLPIRQLEKLYENLLSNDSNH